MGTDWIYSSRGLPRDGEPIAFLLDFRDVPINGTYARRHFLSRWAEYDADHVRCWRNLPASLDLETLGSNQAAAVLPGTRNDDTSEHRLIAGV